MIIVSMGAGLGNQMFEYAFLTKMRRLYPDQIIKADTRYAFPYAHNGIELFNIFDVKADIATREEVLKLARGYLLNGEGFEKKGIIARALRKIGLQPTTMFIQKDYTEYYDFLESLDPRKSMYLYGPFANYRYFADIATEIKELYTFPEITESHNILYAEQIDRVNSVSIHIRKGDYVKEGIQLTPADFYYKAIEMIESKTGKAQFFVFTDDLEYARSIFGEGERFTYIEGNDRDKSFRDMQLMAMCKHNITANSTFSFWGAFLNANPDKIVIAPNIHFAGLANLFVCEDWIVI